MAEEVSAGNKEHAEHPLDGQVAIVTGGGWNIGRAVAERFARAGARVVVAGRRKPLLDETVARIREAGGEALAVPTDAAEPDQVDALVRRTLDAYGGIDVLAALAGGGLVHVPLEQVTPEAWQAVFRSNVFTTFLCTRAVLPTLREQNRGSVLTCAGGGAFFPMLGPEYNAYACAKAAVCRFTDQMVAELWETRIRVNCLEPGMVLPAEQVAALEDEGRRTGQRPQLLDANHAPEEAADLALWLVSAASEPLRGRCVSVNDTWWRDPDQVAAVHATVHAYRLRRADL